MGWLGIDLGTSNTLVAGLGSDGEPVLLKVAGESTTPTLAFVDPTGKWSFGREAREDWADLGAEEGRAFRRWKLRMGAGEELYHGGPPAGDTAITPELLTREFLQRIIDHVTVGLGGESVASVAVSVPHGWRKTAPEKCGATRDAAQSVRPSSGLFDEPPILVSEPIAAAAYWIHRCRKAGMDQEIDGQTLLVCDVGGGTFDLSLVRVGGPRSPLDVVAAAHGEIAGDYATALLTAHGCSRFNDVNSGARMPTCPEAVLGAISGDHHCPPEIRRWFLAAETFIASASAYFTRQSGRGRPLPFTLSSDEKAVQVRHDSLSFAEVLQPFSDTCYTLVAEFLRKHQCSAPYAVLFSGGGSRIFGVSQAVGRALSNTYGEAAGSEAMGRISTNPEVRDQAIALGTALIANGVVSVTERLLYDVGMVVEIESEQLCRVIGVSVRSDVLLTPLLKRGSPLPVSVGSEALGLGRVFVLRGETRVSVVVDNDAAAPFVQEWVLQPQDDTPAEWEMLVDADGVLGIHIRGDEDRRYSGLSEPASADSSSKGVASLRRVAPQQLANFISEARAAG